jgi:hypothetical protein
LESNKRDGVRKGLESQHYKDKQVLHIERIEHVHLSNQKRDIALEQELLSEEQGKNIQKNSASTTGLNPLHDSR